LKNMKKMKAALFLATMVVLTTGFWSCDKGDEPCELVFTSWRTDDVDEMNQINAEFTQNNPNISIKFDPVEVTAYEKTTLDRLASGSGADIILLRPYDKGHEVYDGGYLSDLTEIIPSLSSYQSTALKAWTTDNGVTYGVPSVWVTHGIYYNKSVFNQYNIQEPATWAEFIAACETLYNQGQTAIAQGAVDGWTLYELVFCGLGANFYGGEPARQALINGSKKLTDPNFIEAFEMVNSISKYFPTGYKTLDYEGARDLFGEGKAAMFISGSWEISVMEGYGFNSNTLGWFAPPVKKAGDKLQYVFHVDAAIGLNKNAKNKDAALEYIKWVSGPAYANALMTLLPGFFTYTPGTFTIGNALANEMAEVSKTADLTIRLMSEKLSSKSPAGNTLMGEALSGMLKGQYTPQSAASWAQQQLENQGK
jgi:raffinose/stachyose/melibiose transport system substrate-binding protein